ncbi:unnamed protein product [Caenorhabditis nigoni]
MKLLQGKHLQGEKINDLLKQWINGEGIQLEKLVLLKWRGYPANVIFDGIVTMETKLTEDQVKRISLCWNKDGKTVDIRRKIDGKLATVHINQSGCFVKMCNEQRLVEL